MSNYPMQGPKASLLIGPTGSGKSPFGDWLQSNGLWGRRCHHFDFGACLRAVAGGGNPAFTPREIRFVQDVVRRGALLENESFPIALRILREFAAQRNVQSGDLLLMNGLPRHAGQAESLAGQVEFSSVLELRCTAATVLSRLREDAGGDRAGRSDDTIELVGQKLEVFERRTRPLIDYYRSRGVPVFPLEVGPLTQPSDLAAQLPAVP
jgi:adenylate kinase